jgi:hypothetical protein
MLRSLPWLCWPLWNICVTNVHGYVSFVVNTSWSFPHSRLITGFVTRLIRRVQLAEQELLALPEHLSSPPVFSEVRVTRSLVFCLFCRSLFVLLYFIRLAIVLIYGFWLPLWYLQALLEHVQLYIHIHVIHLFNHFKNKYYFEIWS